MSDAPSERRAPAEGERPTDVDQPTEPLSATKLAGPSEATGEAVRSEGEPSPGPDQPVTDSPAAVADPVEASPTIPHPPEQDVVAEELIAPPPVAEEPVVDEPVVAEEPTEPVVDEPVAGQPPVAQPVAVEQPTETEPVAAEPVGEQPVAEEEPAEPVGQEPMPAAVRTQTEPVAEEPVLTEPVAEEPVLTEPVAEEPIVQQPVAEQPAAERLVAQEPPAGEEEPPAQEQGAGAEEEAVAELGEAPDGGRPRRTLSPALLAFLTLAVLGLVVGAFVVGQKATDDVRKATDPQSQAPSRPANFVTFEDKEAGFRIDHPKEWTRLLEREGDRRLVLRGPGEGENGVAVTVVPQEQIEQRITEFSEGLKQAQTQGTQILEERPVTINGLSGYYYLYTYKDQAKNQDGVHLHYFLRQGPKLHIIVMQAFPAQGLDRLAQDFTQMLASFRTI